MKKRNENKAGEDSSREVFSFDSKEKKKEETKHILIVGGGFGGLMAAERLVKIIGSEHRITLVSTHDKFTFYPALVRLAFGDCQPAEITFDLIEKTNELNVRFVQGEMITMDPKLKQVKIAGDDFDGTIGYDFLVIAPGRRLATEKMRGFFEHAHHLLGIKAAQKFGAAVDEFKKGSIVVGLSPQAFLPVPVCETAFALAKKFSEEIKNNDISIRIVFPETIKQAFGGADLHQKLEKAFAKHRINVTTGFAVKEVTAQAIISDDDRTIDHDLLMLLPPFRGQSRIKDLNFTDELDFIKVDNYLRVQDLSSIYAVGDAAAFPGPKLAYMAVRQAQVAAENIASEMRGALPTKIYHHDVAVIIDEGGEDSIFLNYGIWDETLYGMKIGKMWSRMKQDNNQLWQVVRDG